MASVSPHLGLDFFATARVKKVVQIDFEHSTQLLFAAIAEDPAGWGLWFPGFTNTGRYITASPHGVGSVREVTFRSNKLGETILAWDNAKRWAFYVSSGRTGMRALAEDYRFDVGPSGTRLTWTMAAELGPVTRLAAPLILAVAVRTVRKAGANLDRRLSGGYRPCQNHTQPPG